MNKIAPSLKTLRACFIADGQVFTFLSGSPTDPLFVSLGNDTVALTPCLPRSLGRFNLNARTSLQCDELPQDVVSVPAEKTPGQYYAVWVNKLPDWSLSGHQTVQVLISERQVPCQVKIQRPVVVQKREPGMVFKALLGIHRAEAKLHVTFSSSKKNLSENKIIKFDGRFQGGQQEAGYQEISLALPEWDDQIEIRMTLEYLRFVDDGSGYEPFLFVADPHVEVPQNSSGVNFSPLFLLGSSDSCHGKCFSARLPRIPVPGEKVCLTAGEHEACIELPAARDIKVDDQYGHTLIIESASAEEMCLYIDGEPSASVFVERGHTPIRISPSVLDGNTHFLSLRDKSGTVRYWEDYCLLPQILTPADVMLRESTAPFPASIFPQTARRFANLRGLLKTVSAETDFAQLSHAMNTVEGGYENVKLKPLHLPEHEKPTVSIVIPAHNKVEVTYLALCSLLVAPNQASFEVIVVDDASTDETATLEEIVSGITVIHNETAQRFIRACNAGAQVARGEYIVLLNNDVEVTAGWLDELIAAFQRFDNVGLAGSKLLYPNGRLQDAGGIIWGSGNPWNYGNRQNPDEPRFSYARQADYLCGAAMMVPKKIWDEVGGLSSYLEPMYFEDTDFAFKVRDAGYKTWFVPSSVVYHSEGMSSRTDVSKGFKRFQEVNRPKFRRRWADAYARFGREGHMPDLEKDRGIHGRVLFIDYSTPRPDLDAGSYAALQEIRLVQSLGFKVTFLPTNLAHLGKYTEDLQKIGVEMIYAPFFMSTQEYLDKHAADFDAVYITRYYTARDVLADVRRNAPNTKVLFNNADLHFLRELRAARAENDERKLENALRTREIELEIIKKVDVVLSYNTSEHAVIEAFSDGAAKIVRTPWVVTIPEKCPSLETRSGMSFLGSFKHHPNEEGILWFTKEVMPLVLGTTPDMKLSIYGSGMNDKVKDLESDNINPVGFVEDLADAFDAHRIFIAPLLSGAGIKGKVLEALSRGVPCVLSPHAAEGVGLRNGHDCFIARTADEWAEAIQRLNTDDTLWQAMSDRARAYMAEDYSFESGRKLMREAFEAADIFVPASSYEKG